MLKKLLSCVVLLALAFGIGVGAVLLTPASVGACSCGGLGCWEYSSSCGDCGGGPCNYLWSDHEIGGPTCTDCCGDLVLYRCI